MFNKEALKKKMGKVVNIQISVDDEEQKKSTDLAPDVKDSPEQGVVKETPNEQVGHVGGQVPAHMPSHEPDFGGEVSKHLMSGMPDHPASGKTLDSMAKERMLSRMHAKKGLKV